MASTLAMEFNFPLKKAFVPPQPSNNDTVDSDVHAKARSNDNSPVQALPLNKTPRQYGRQSFSQKSAGTSSLNPNNTSLFHFLEQTGTDALSQYLQSVMTHQENNSTGSTSRGITKLYNQSDDSDDDNDSDWTDESDSVPIGDSSKDNTKAPVANPSQQELEALIDNNIEAISKHLNHLAAQAKRRDIELKYKLAESHRMGSNGVIRSDEIAIELYLKAAREGHAGAQLRLGGYYEEGFSVPKDYVKAFEWYLKAAMQGHVHAQCNVGYMYKNGYGVREDKNVALEWFLKAANGGYMPARLAYVHLKEDGYSPPSKK
ncbi:hypothetical protein BG015_011927 [Linnemannia schmuckeri]|uniref:HCP-like protein n=1 Tax=Linnemannia schmuckeri TaxID=64567 RepID=A0A9P5S565_9FUNG|nr:hypothetical protein BG015_011927 [Linnemannia schmuckeri]